MPNLASDIRRFCSQNNLRLNTNLGQHFLTDYTVLSQIIKAAHIEPRDSIIEIGPGIGVLTRRLLEEQAHVTAIEIDERMIPLVQKYIGDLGNLKIINENALQASFPNKLYKIVANIPYHITSPLLRKAFLESPRPPTSMTLLIQREVAEKICDTRNAGMLTVIVGLFGKPKIITHVKPKSFLPPPKVDSSVLHIDCFEKPLVEPELIEKIMKLTKLAFGQKRKMLRNSLGSLPNGMELMQQASIDPTRRPQTLSIDEWISLAATLSS